jgi:DNA-binding NarL/FixJ family response regulator
MMTAPATLLLVHNMPHVLMVWRNVLRPHCGHYHIGGEVANARQMLKAAATLQPAIVLIDAGMAGKGLVAFVKKLQASATQAKLLVCWQYSHQHLVQPIPGAVVAYLSEDAQPWETVVALNHLMNGKVYHCRQSERLLRRQAKSEPLPGNWKQLVWCRWQGHSAKDMAAATGLKISTVNDYLKKIYAHIGSGSMAAFEHFMKKEGML